MLQLLVVSPYPRLAACKSLSPQVSVSRPVIASYLDLTVDLSAYLLGITGTFAKTLHKLLTFSHRQCDRRWVITGEFQAKLKRISLKLLTMVKGEINGGFTRCHQEQYAD
jgi:hypothetical protein